MKDSDIEVENKSFCSCNNYWREEDMAIDNVVGKGSVEVEGNVEWEGREEVDRIFSWNSKDPDNVSLEEEDNICCKCIWEDVEDN
ncbi:hypothetical protein TcasGA2_TC015565 [Tribolium castaneum]|uniref:Uncharacterized protein n=1 Tax=Tribolium castaneum TaxID=7070 RepID=D2A5M7_TRICA|nr:hypothetical protein TcasGA2_TC015565 [Tribolium castaneum]